MSTDAERRPRRARESIALPRRMAPTDALFWFAETALPEFRPIIAALYVLDRTPDAAAARASIDSGWTHVPRLRQRVVAAPGDLGLPEWRADPHFDAEYHVRHLSLPAPGGQRELLDLAARRCSRRRSIGSGRCGKPIGSMGSREAVRRAS